MRRNIILLIACITFILWTVLLFFVLSPLYLSRQVPEHKKQADKPVIGEPITPESHTFLPPELDMRDFRLGSPIFIRIFKQESALEIWTSHEGRYRLLKTFPICSWSGALGPKLREGDWQAPEGFYTLSAKQLHPTSRYYRAFNLGFPNAHDKQLGRTGSFLMVHGNCVSVGCYAMTDQGIAEIYPIVEAALNAGQKEIQVQIFPFRMNEKALSAVQSNRWYAFWKNLKEGYDQFEKTKQPPQAYACNGRYVFDKQQAQENGCKRIAGW